jgi:hypothetical protein
MATTLDEKGFEIVPSFETSEWVESYRALIELQFPAIAAAGIRNIAQKCEPIRLLAENSVARRLVDERIGGPARLVRSILFNKSPDANWLVAWHQDLSIAVEERAVVPGYENWTVKDGVHHVQPPVEILERMLTVRLHLDDANEGNGALWVVPGSHRLGRIRADEAADVAKRMGKHLCTVNAGDAMIFRPLLLHASRKATSANPRRVIHLEFATDPLPAPLKWAEGTDLVKTCVYDFPGKSSES